MLSSRLRLTLVYLAGLLATAVIMGVALSSARTSAVYGDAGRTALAHAKLAERLIQQTRMERLWMMDSLRHHVLTPQAQEQLEDIPGYLVVIDHDGTVQYASRDIRALAENDRITVQRGMEDLPDDGPAGVLQLSTGQVLLVALGEKDQTLGVRRIIAGVGVDEAVSWPRDLALTLLLVVPCLIALSTWGAWAGLGKLFARLERIRQEVADITDGRSLHRRLSADATPPELASVVSTLNAMIARLETSFLALRRFTADASHELKTPLAVLRADIERAMNEATTPAERMVALEEALHETTRMADLVESLLTLARADEGRFDLHREPVPLRELVQEVYETALILGEGAGVTVTLPFTTDVTVLGDRARLRQLFLNLVTNAIKYTPAGGRVDLGLGRHPETVTFAVRDTGIGIAAAELPHLFERFWRADRVRSRTSERGGFGLGLAISQWIAQAHGGALTVSSRLGKGSLFTVTLPLPPQEQPSSTLNPGPISA